MSSVTFLFSAELERTTPLRHLTAKCTRVAFLPLGPPGASECSRQVPVQHVNMNYLGSIWNCEAENMEAIVLTSREYLQRTSCNNRDHAWPDHFRHPLCRPSRSMDAMQRHDRASRECPHSNLSILATAVHS